MDADGKPRSNSNRQTQNDGRIGSAFSSSGHVPCPKSNLGGKTNEQEKIKQPAAGSHGC